MQTSALARLNPLTWFRGRPARAKRSFDAARVTRFTHTFFQGLQSINSDLRGDLDMLRRRARQLAKNEPIVKRYLSMVAANVVGPEGFTLQSRVAMDNGATDTQANAAIEAAWSDWCRPQNCDLGRRLSFADICRAAAIAAARDGEALLRLHRSADNPHGFAVQLLDIERLHTMLNREADSSHNAIIMGVEIDADGRAVAYHLVTRSYGRDVLARKVVRVPAEEIVHLYVTDNPEQVRGYPWMHAAMLRLHYLGGYEEAAIIAARVGAAKMGFFTRPDGDATPLGDGLDRDEIPYTEAEPGAFGVLPEGTTFEPFNPDYPHQMYESFIKAAKRDISSGLDVAYHALANDLQGVNFSSIRSGTLEERDQWMCVQRWMVTHLLDRVYDAWLECALLAGTIRGPNGNPLPAAKLQKFRAHAFLGRRWQWVDPLKDIQAAVTAMENGIADPYTIAAQQGSDADDVLEGLARFQAAAKEKGVELGARSERPAAESESESTEGKENAG